MDKRLLELLVCPVCKGPLSTAGSGSTLELICRPDRLAYAVRDGIPLMLPGGSARVGRGRSLAESLAQARSARCSMS